MSDLVFPVSVPDNRLMNSIIQVSFKAEANDQKIKLEELKEAEAGRKEDIATEANQRITNDDRYKALINARIATQEALKSGDQAKFTEATAKEKELEKSVDDLRKGEAAMQEHKDPELQMIKLQALAAKNIYEGFAGMVDLARENDEMSQQHENIQAQSSLGQAI